jgi:hypothetical protein
MLESGIDEHERGIDEGSSWFRASLEWVVFVEIRLEMGWLLMCGLQ